VDVQLRPQKISIDQKEQQTLINGVIAELIKNFPPKPQR
jgi:hypothetical protein